MMPKKILISILVLTGIAQIVVPISMVYNHNAVLKNGTELRIPTIPVDPNDIFRGKYINLRFTGNGITRPISEEWKRNENVYITFGQNDAGYAYITDILRKAPAERSDYIKTRIERVSKHGDKNTQSVYVKFPFNRFYMEESKAPVAETIYNTSARDKSSSTCALLLVADGRFVLKDVLIDNVSIADLSRNGE